MKIKSCGKLTSGFCGYLHCKNCIAKRRPNPYHKSDNIFVCKSCEENAIKVRLWEDFSTIKRTKEAEVETMKENLARVEQEWDDLKLEYDRTEKEQKNKCSTIEEEIRAEEEREIILKEDLDAHKKSLEKSILDERTKDKQISDLNNLIFEYKKRINEVKCLTDQLTEDNDYDKDFKTRTSKQINDIVFTVQRRLEERDGNKDNLNKNSKNKKRRKTAYRSQEGSESYDPNPCSCRCTIF